jgi:hypothetical protein
VQGAGLQPYSSFGKTNVVQMRFWLPYKREVLVLLIHAVRWCSYAGFSSIPNILTAPRQPELVKFMAFSHRIMYLN